MSATTAAGYARGLALRAREAADVVSGVISQRALDTAQRMIAVGKGREAAADYLDAQYRLVTASRNARDARRASAFRDDRTVSSDAYDGLIEHYAQRHELKPDEMPVLSLYKQGILPKLFELHKLKTAAKG